MSENTLQGLDKTRYNYQTVVMLIPEPIKKKVKDNVIFRCEGAFYDGLQQVI